MMTQTMWVMQYTKLNTEFSRRMLYTSPAFYDSLYRLKIDERKKDGRPQGIEKKKKKHYWAVKGLWIIFYYYYQSL